MSMEYLVSVLVTLVVVVDPVGLAPIFAGLTQELPERTRRGVAVRASAIAAGVLAGFALAGHWLLVQLGISLPAFRIAGGLLLFSIAAEMAYGHRTERQSATAAQAQHADHAHHIAAFPLAIPLLAGPGAITATVLLAGRAAGSPAMMASLLGAIAAVALLCLLVFCLASRVMRLFGTTGNVVLSRLLGILLAVMAVQFVIDGVRAAFAA